MSTVIRSVISKKNPYHISKHRTLELKHFCMQYEEWRQEYVKLTVLQSYGYGKIPGGWNIRQNFQNCYAGGRT